MTLVLVGALLLIDSINIYAAENVVESRDYTPIEGTSIDPSIMMGTELQNGEKIIVGDYTIEYSENTVCLNPHSRATTKDYNHTSHYKITNNGSEQEWYKIVQTTNYTYDGKTARINTDRCNLNVTKYYAEGRYTVDDQTVDNSSSTDPTHTVKLTMQFPSRSLTIKDVVTVHADGTHNYSHYE